MPRAAIIMNFFILFSIEFKIYLLRHGKYTLFLQTKQ